MILKMDMLKEVWTRRDFMWSSVKREFAARWTGTQFGPFWLLAQPLATILIFTVIFVNIMRPGMPAHDSKFAYSIYLCAGILTFNLFAEMLGRSVVIFVDNANLLKKIYFPKLCLPIIVMVSSLLNFAVTMSLFSCFLLIARVFPGWVVLAVLPVLAVQVVFTMGLGMFLACINVFYRDVQQAVQVLVQFWFWLTPIVYIPATLPDWVGELLCWNPLFPLIQAYQGIFLEQAVPDWASLVYPGLLGVFFALLGIFAFYRLQGEIVDAL
ncbi:MAG: ABC transporter permease [Desulfotignum sp.]|jgi:lipopolysaccharide transport system permease protein|nr:ABC transporter permease [Desulfotignum sp.]